jgi:peroxiredoxin
LEGGDASLSEILGKGPTLLSFFKINCPVCQLALPYLDRLDVPGKLAVFGISQNNERDTREFMTRFGIRFPMLLDTRESGYTVSNQFGISHVPTSFLLEADSCVGRIMEGWRKSEIQWLAGLAGVNPFRPEDSVPEAKAG